MLQRTKGRFLLTLLVITGLAGTLKNSTLTKTERKLAVTELKETKEEILQSIKGLSKAQLAYKSTTTHRSIKEAITDLALTEKNLWNMLGTAMQQQAVTGPRHAMTDEDLSSLVNNPGQAIPLSPSRSKAAWKTAAGAVSAFKDVRTDHIRYTKSTTEDLRNHFIQLPAGQIDAYQFIRLVAAHSSRFVQQINDIKQEPGFPKH